MCRPFLTSLTVGAFVFGAVLQAHGVATYPQRPIRLIIPGPLGSPPDVVGRVVGAKLASALAQPVVFDNRQGATGIIGLQSLSKSAPDGYTLGVMSTSYIVMANLVSKMPYDPERDFAPIVLINWHSSILAVAANSPMKSVADLVETAKANPGALRLSSSGNGTPSHIAGQLFQHDAGLTITHVPYKGPQASVLGLLTGQVDMTISTVGALSAHLKAGKVRALATTAPQRIAVYPDLPTLTELGYANVHIKDWQGIVAPAKTPRELIMLLHAQIDRIVAMPDVKQRLEGFGMEVARSVGPEQFTAYLHDEMQRWGKLVRETGLKVE